MTVVLRPHLDLLSPAEAGALHEQSLARLMEPGVRLCPEALDRLAAAGCDVDRAEGVARIPGGLVDRALASAPRTVRLAGRLADRELVLDGGRPHFALGSPWAPAPDPHVAHLAGVLPEIEAVHAGSDEGGLGPLAAVWRVTGKHVRLRATRPALVPLLLEMAAAAGTGNGGPAEDRAAILSAAICPGAPLHPDTGPTRAAMALAPAGVPIVVAARLGRAAPEKPGESFAAGRAWTPLRVAVEANAGFLALLVLIQFTRPGAPAIYGLDARPGSGDGEAPIPDASAGLTTLLVAGLARHYRLPLSLPGLAAPAARLGPLAGWQGIGPATLAVLAGADEVCGLGLLGADRAPSPEKLIHDAEQARQLARLGRGIEAGDEQLQAGAIARVGQHGHYLLERETRRFMRAEIMPRRVRDDRSPGEWLAAGRDEAGRLAAEAERLLRDSEPATWPLSTEQAISAIVAEAERRASTEGARA